MSLTCKRHDNYQSMPHALKNKQHPITRHKAYTYKARRAHFQKHTTPLHTHKPPLQTTQRWLFFFFLHTPCHDYARNKHKPLPNGIIMYLIYCKYIILSFVKAAHYYYQRRISDVTRATPRNCQTAFHDFLMRHFTIP